MNMFKSGYVALVGVPNAGKSSLVNQLVGEDVSIVTSKPQTTRLRTLGITNEENLQIIWVDTPGIIDSGKGLNPLLRAELEEALEDVDHIIATVAFWELKESGLPWLFQIWDKIKDKAIVTLTQVDKITADQRVELCARMRNLFGDVLETSSVTGEGVAQLKALIEKRLKPGPRFFEEDVFTTQTMREMAQEIIRKHCFENLHQEVPYGLTVIVREFREKPILEISADIIVNKMSHKGMVIGQKGQMLKSIGSAARLELEKVFGQKVFLQSHVMVRENWMRDKMILKDSGFRNA